MAIGLFAVLYAVYAVALLDAFWIVRIGHMETMHRLLAGLALTVLPVGAGFIASPRRIR